MTVYLFVPLRKQHPDWEWEPFGPYDKFGDPASQIFMSADEARKHAWSMGHKDDTELRIIRLSGMTDETTKARP